MKNEILNAFHCHIGIRLIPFPSSLGNDTTNLRSPATQGGLIALTTYSIFAGLRWLANYDPKSLRRRSHRNMCVKWMNLWGIYLGHLFLAYIMNDPKNTLSHKNCTSYKSWPWLMVRTAEINSLAGTRRIRTTKTWHTGNSACDSREFQRWTVWCKEMKWKCMRDHRDVNANTKWTHSRKVPCTHLSMFLWQFVGHSLCDSVWFLFVKEEGKNNVETCSFSSLFDCFIAFQSNNLVSISSPSFVLGVLWFYRWLCFSFRLVHKQS